jgi:hypothetical protein
MVEQYLQHRASKQSIQPRYRRRCNFLAQLPADRIEPGDDRGTNLMSHSGLNAGSLDNMGWLVPEDGSENWWQSDGLWQYCRHRWDHSHRRRRPHQRTIGLVDHSQLYLGSTYGLPTSGPPNPTAFKATVDMDPTSISSQFYDLQYRKSLKR